MDVILFKAVSQRSQVFISCLTGVVSRMITSFTCKENVSKLKVSDFKQQGLRWRCSVFVYLPILCFYCDCNQA